MTAKKMVSFVISGSITIGMLAFPFALALAATPNWTLNAPVPIVFSCSAASYPHTLTSVSQDVNGNLLGSGWYDADHTYTWNLTGTITGNNIAFAITYTGTAAPTIYNSSGTIAADGSITGSTDGNCQSFSMPAGSATPLPTQPPAGSCKLVSDTTTMVGANSASLTFVHSAWTHSLDATGAQWIWNAPFATPSDTVDEVVTFTKTFNVVGTPSNVQLDIAADNSYGVLVNTLPASCDGSGLNNFNSTSGPSGGPDSCNITALVHGGVNTLTFKVTNAHGYGTDPTANPAGLDYAVTITGATCAAVPPPTTDKDACKKGGWKTMTNPTFKNQGQCIKAMNHKNHSEKSDSKDSEHDTD